MLDVDEELRKAIMDASLDDSTKIIRYLDEQSKKQSKYNIFMLVVTLIGAVGSIIAAITGLILFFK